MITLLVIISAAIAIGAFWKHDIIDEYQWYKHLEGWLLGLVVSGCIFVGFIIVGSVIVILLCATGLIDDKEIGRENFSMPIYSLKNDSGVSGSFFLGSGGINSTEYYYMFSGNNGGYERLKLNADNCIIFQDENNSPNIRWQVTTYEISKIWVAFPHITWTVNTKNEIHVPEKTIIQQFRLD